MNDFEALVDKYKGKMSRGEIKEALKILLEKKNEYRMNSANIFITMFLGFAAFILGFNLNSFNNLDSNLKIIVPIAFIILVFAIIIIVFIFNLSNPYNVRLKDYEAYLDAIKKLDAIESTPSEPKPVENQPPSTDGHNSTSKNHDRQLQFDLVKFQSVEQISMSSDIALFVLGATFIITSYQVTNVLIGIKISDVMFWGGEIIALYSLSSLIYYLIKIRKKNLTKLATDHNLQYNEKE